MVVPSDALTDRMTQLEVNLTNLPAGRYNVRVTVTNDVAAEVAGHDAVVVVSEPPQSSQQQETESDDALLPTDSLGFVTVSPGTPTVTQEGAEVLISWTAGVGNVELYYLARGLITGCQSGCWEVITTDGPDTSYRDLGVAPGRTYRYRVQAKYANTRSHFSAFTSITTAAVAEGVPKPPSGLTVRYDVPAAAIVLSWTAPDPASDVRNYRFNRCSFTSPTSSEDISCGEMLTGSTDTAYSDTTVEPGHSLHLQQAPGRRRRRRQLQNRLGSHFRAGRRNADRSHRPHRCPRRKRWDRDPELDRSRSVHRPRGLPCVALQVPATQ